MNKETYKLNSLIPENMEQTESLELLPLVEEMLEKNLISWDMYHLFISEERSHGSIPFTLKEGKFVLPFMDCSEYSEGNIPFTPEEEMFFHIYQVANTYLEELKGK